MKMEEHTCIESNTCSCYMYSIEPNEDCPIHGHPGPPRCAICGRFMKWEETTTKGEYRPMKTKITKKVTITLELEYEEAVWLKTLLQNPVNADFNSESSIDREMRERFWKALSDIELGGQFRFDDVSLDDL